MQLNQNASDGKIDLESYEDALDAFMEILPKIRRNV